ncbi:oxidoreductase [Aliikangiella sp. G2MR2-5]|uniref:oxidoreductase n=1 Tax=Aliikangiella sp. G2MR2-5 TaxID=2788943 RepID=UPI0018AB62D2|nr:oxidoreductase [Aliikangiella sp. G2MR2-5]
MIASDNSELFFDLVTLEKNSFPKKCVTCGEIYNTVDEFISRTVDVHGKSGLKSSEDDDGEVVLELFRNCVCGSTLLDFFENRRDTSEQGLKRRNAFDRVMHDLVSKGLEEEVARKELKYYMKHGTSKILEQFGVFKKRIKKRSES